MDADIPVKMEKLNITWETTQYKLSGGYAVHMLIVVFWCAAMAATCTFCIEKSAVYP